MNQENFFLLVPVISLLLATITVMIALKNKKKISKYYPAILISALTIFVCIIISIVNNSSYNIILYIVILLSAGPGVLLSLFIAVLFDVRANISNRKIDE